MAVTLIQADLEFILQQILYAEAHADGADLNDLLPNVFVPWGLRTVDGSYNNLVPGQQFFGAADQPFPTLLDPEFRSGYQPPNLNVVDAQPRVISNLIVDQTISNPAAVQAFVDAGFGLRADGTQINPDNNLPYPVGTLLDLQGIAIPAGVTLTIPNATPDEGLSAGFNTWFVFFGQFFDHGLDFIQRGTEIVMIPFAPDDPIFIEHPDAPPFMIIERTLKDADGNAINRTTPFVDQNQTYTSHPSHQVFLREYVLDETGRPVATGELIKNQDGGMATWADVKNQARDVLGIELTDFDVGRVPLVATDAYGNFIPGENGFPQLITGTPASPVLVEGSLTTAALASTAIATGHAFIIDIAHSAAPFGDHDGNPSTPPQALNPDVDTMAGGDPGVGFYDDELLDAHLMAGDGRANENIALSAVHHVFHSEHNRLVAQTKETVRAALLAGDEEFAAAWVRGDTLADRLAVVADGIQESEWNGERLFQVARFGTEMQYQHLVFEEFARKVQPNVDEFLMYDATIDPAIVAEFAHVVYRFGHSMLTDTVDRFDPEFNVVGDEQITLIEAFLNPFEFSASSPGDADADAGAIVRGTTRQLGNEIDEFVTEALRNNLLGLPLDLASINLARGRETGVPTLNAARAEFYRGTGDSQLEAYSSWADFGANLKHFESLVNFIAAYGTHTSITAAGTLAAKRAAAYALVYGEGGIDGDVATVGDNPTVSVPADRLDFLNSTDNWANSTARPKDLDGVTNTGLGNVDLWIGGLAERQMPFGGLLGSTFNFVFETQLEALQNGDRFYYLARTAGLNFLNELENNSFAKLIMANTDATHLPADVFSTPGLILEVDRNRQFNGELGSEDPLGDHPLRPLVIRNNPATPGTDTNYLEYTGDEHVVLGGTDGDDIMIASIGDDTLWGDAGNDRLEGGDGVDNIEGGTGDDIITDLGGDDVLKGNEGNDVIHGGNGFNLLIGGPGQDFIITGEDVSETFAGTGNDFIYGAKTNLPTLGNEGDDWIEIGTQDGAPGDNFDALAGDTVNGNDIFVGGGGFDEMLGEGGDDIFVGSEGEDHFDGDSGFDWVTFKNDTRGVTADMTVSDIVEPPVAPSNAGILDRYAFVEGLSGSALSDHLRGDDADAVDIAAGGAQGSVLTQAGIDLIEGLQELLGAGVTSFGSGNIILGGSGSDIIEGRGGDDLIDGDRWLNVRISIRDPNDHSIEWASADSMVGEVTQTNPAAPANITGPLHLLMLSGLVNPGQLQAVREILQGADAFDTAVFSGLRGDYSIVFDANGTTDLSDDVVIVTDNVGTDGSDRLINIERLQFADQVVLVDPINGPSLNAGPAGLAIIDGIARQGQTLAVRILSVPNGPDVLVGVSDADNSNGGAIAKPFQVVWQAEVEAGTEVFEDIVLEGGDKASTASGTSFVVPDGLEGLAIRVKVIYQDADGTLEMAFSGPTAAVEDAPAPVVPALPVESPTQSAGVHFIRSDLQFILDQIKVAERHAGGEDLSDILPNSRVPFGLRTVDGSFNNLVLGQEHFGAADQPFPSLLDQLFRNENDDTLFMDVNGPLPGGLVPLVTNDNYAANGDVVDFDPRIISNLIVDQTPNNPAAIAAALTAAGSENITDDTATVQAAYRAILDATTPEQETAARAAFNAVVGELGLEVVSSPGLDGEFGTDDDKDVFFLGNRAADEGLSAGFNAWMTFFGQFFDHGLDLVNKGGNGIIYIPLQPDDPLYVPGGATNFMVLTRATNIAVQPGEDGVLGTEDDRHFHNNQTTPFVDQNQTYTSHPSHQVFLREYAMVDVPNDGIDGLVPVDTGRLLEGINGGLATWADVKQQAASKLGIALDDLDVLNLPLLATDPYGNFIRGPNGLPQLVTLGNPSHVEGDLDNPVDASQAIRSNHAFLDDIAHTAVPVGDLDHNPNTPPTPLAADGDDIAGPVANPAFNPELPVGPGNQPFLAQPAGTYDDELLDRHFTTGDGRGNENIGLTAVHHVFHSEHNRLVEHIKAVVLASNDPAFVQEWVLPGSNVANGVQPEEWNGARLFQAARFGTEMQYQHLVFEEFARKIQPQVDIFFAPTQVYDTAINPAILAEFAHVVYRFGHSMLTETIDRFDADFDLVGTGAAEDQQIGLIAAFLNPLEFAASGATADEAAGAIVRGTTRQLGNEIDEFVTEALRNNLLGLPLDLPAINLARGRDTGVPPLNLARAEFYAMTGDSQLKPYVSWVDFMNNLKHPESIINFIAAYGTHNLITAETTLEGKRAAAFAIVTGAAATVFGEPGAGDDRTISAPTDRLDFLNATGTYAGDAALGGLNLVDLWIGGLAERKMPFGGFLGSTFNFVFETQMEMLQDGDRFYYLDRTNGLNFLTELENNSFAKLIMANTDAKHLPGDVFSTPAFILEVDQSQQYTGLDPDGRGDPEGVVIRNNPTTIGPDSNYLEYTGEDHIVLGGTNPGNEFNLSGNDILVASIGDDTVYGDDGNDRIEGGDGNDFLIGGRGDDIITDQGGDDNIQGLDGNDVIQAGNGINLILGGFGRDFIITGEDASEAFGGVGDDFILGVRANEAVFGNEGDDWLQFGMADGGAGDNFDSFAADPVPGNDIFYGDSLTDRMDGEGGDDIMMGNGGQGDRYEGMSGFDWASFQHLGAGVAVDMRIRAFDETPLPLGSPGILTRYEAVEGLSGSAFSDVLRGDDADAATIAAAGVLGHGGAIGSVLTNIALIDGLQGFLDTLLGGPVTSFGAGNIILGGDGSDIMIGGGGDDLIDGDMALNVYISVRTNPADPNSEIDRAFELQELVPFMLSGQYNPSQLVVVRELAAPGDSDDFDTARFSDVFANYVITIDDGGTEDFGDDIVTVQHAIDDGGVIVIGPDGTDTLRHVERLQFADQALVLDGSNVAPDGLLEILDATSGDPDDTPTENQLLRVSIANVTDPNNLGGAITGEVSYFWQVEEDPGSGSFEDIIIEDSPQSGGETIRATGETFRPGDPESGLRLRVKAVYQDANGVLEEVYSAPTQAVADVNDLPVGTISLSDASPTETLALSAINAFTDVDGIDGTVVFSYLWETSANGSTWVAATDGGLVANDAVFIPTQSAVGQFLRVTVSYTDLQGNLNTLASTPSTFVVGNRIITNGGTQIIDGASTPNQATEGADLISTGAGTDFINSLGGDDTIDGGTGLDIIDAGDGDDTINYTLGGGADVVSGGAGVDTLAILGAPGAETFTVAFNGSSLTSAGVGSFNTVERITLDLLGGNNTLSYGTSAAAATVNLMAGQASGFTSIANVQNVTGGNGNDAITGGLGSNILSGGNGNDTLFALNGDGNDVVNGNGGIDTYDLSATSAAATISTASAVSTDIGTDALTSIENIVGSQGSDTITFNGGANVLDGGGGNDTISAGAGNDSLLGGEGDDTLNGEAGNDTLRGGSGDDNLLGGGNNDLVDGGDGNDTVTYTFGDGIDTVIGGIGTDTLNIVGTAANNILDVVWNGTSLTTFEGGTISAVESVAAALGDGSDSLIYTGSTSPVTVDLGAGTATGFSSISGIENATGGAGADLLTGGVGANVLAGGAGDDTYHVATGDTVNENAGGGTDTVFSSAASFTLGANVENLTLEAGAGNINGSGNGAANTITGNEGDNTLNGGGGNDILNGGAGNDTMVGGTGGDTFVFGPSFGSDVIADFDANGGGTLASQDLLNVSLFTPNLTAADIGGRLTILANGVNTVITIDGTQQITLLGVTGLGNNVITQQDFIF